MAAAESPRRRWQFWIDRGGTFTDIVGRRPDGALTTCKLLSDNPEQYPDAALAGMRRLLGLSPSQSIGPELVECVKMGTTVATNALLERKGEPTLLVTTRGFRDALRIAYQNRPRLFDLRIVLPELLYSRVIEAQERFGANGELVQALDETLLKQELDAAFAAGLRCAAICFMHGYRFTAHEQAAKRLALQAGFSQVSVSHEVSPMMKFVSRGDTTVVDAYLSPILRRYVDQVAAEMPGVPLYFMQSSGGLAKAQQFQGKDAILSGPAGGIVGMARTAELAGQRKVIGFDMGGTSTDVSHYAGEFERQFETQVAGVRMRAPMMSIHTVASGGGSILRFDGARLRVGPQSAGANPGPACYRRGGPLTVTDANLLLGKIAPDWFPKVFGPLGNEGLDLEVVQRQFAGLAAKTGQTPEACAEGFVSIAVQQMANAIKKISVARGYDVTGYTLQCFGGAGGQHACLVADALGMTQVLVHPLAGVLSAYGMGLADQSLMRERSIEMPLEEASLSAMQAALDALEHEGRRELLGEASSLAVIPGLTGNPETDANQGPEKDGFPVKPGMTGFEPGMTGSEPVQPQWRTPDPVRPDPSIPRDRVRPAGVSKGPVPFDTSGRTGDRLGVARPDPAEGSARAGNGESSVQVKRRAHLRYQGSDSALILPFGTLPEMKAAFEAAYLQRFAFLMQGKALVVEAVSVELVLPGEKAVEQAQALHPPREIPRPAQAQNGLPMYCAGQWHTAKLILREDLRPGDQIDGPAIIAEQNATTVLEPGWSARVTELNHLLLHRASARAFDHAAGTQTDPVLLEVFNNLFMNIAEQMGLQLQNTAYSVNIKERLDFSCALFDADGNLVANAPHMPVHLGSMGESIKTVIRANSASMRPGDVYVLNDPYHGGTHLPDVTVITPVYFNVEREDGLQAEPSTLGAQPLFYVGSRGHHADIGGITPGSMPPFSTHIEEEGVQIDNFKLVDAGRLREAEMLDLLSGLSSNCPYPQSRSDSTVRPAVSKGARGFDTSARTVNAQYCPYPSRNPQQNMADLKAQIAANAKGVQELRKMAAEHGLPRVQAYMGHVQDNAEEMVRRVITRLKDGHFTLPLDNGAQIQVAIRVNAQERSAEIDFSGTSKQQTNNFNAPTAVTMAAVLYVFRCLVDDDIPLNAGCLKPLKVTIPKSCMLNPDPPASVVAGNVETSTCITNALFGALGLMAAGQCTMNNFTFGNEQHQYYETISGGSGAGAVLDAQGQVVGGFDGTSVVQTHMTNSRLTDPEVLEFRFPVRLESYEIRQGSGGAGRWRGGDGGVRRVRFLETMTASILSNGRRHGAFGMAGGGAGALGINRVVRADGSVETLDHIGQTQMQTGDIFEIHTPGGGGYG